jgi:cytochrome b subunit of formate dehydrogenase
MNELKEINDQLKALSISVEMISQAITGSKLNRNGILQRLETIEGALEETETKVQEVRDYNTGINWAIRIGAFILTITGVTFIKDFLWHK